MNVDKKFFTLMPTHHRFLPEIAEATGHDIPRHNSSDVIFALNWSRAGKMGVDRDTADVRAILRRNEYEEICWKSLLDKSEEEWLEILMEEELNV